MTRKGYWFGVNWIADNDDPELTHQPNVECMISVCLLADLFGKTPAQVAADVCKMRRTIRVAVP